MAEGMPGIERFVFSALILGACLAGRRGRGMPVDLVGCRDSRSAVPASAVRRIPDSDSQTVD
jgi:hypothetical protein